MKKVGHSNERRLVQLKRLPPLRADHAAINWVPVLSSWRDHRYYLYEIAWRRFIPAILYFVSVYFMVDFRRKRPNRYARYAQRMSCTKLATDSPGVICLSHRDIDLRPFYGLFGYRAGTLATILLRAVVQLAVARTRWAYAGHTQGRWSLPASWPFRSSVSVPAPV